MCRPNARNPRYEPLGANRREAKAHALDAHYWTVSMRILQSIRRYLARRKWSQAATRLYQIRHDIGLLQAEEKTAASAMADAFANVLKDGK